MATTTDGLWYPDSTTPMSIVQMLKSAQESVQTVAGLGAWTAYTPVLSGSSTSPSLGSGGSARARYSITGKTMRLAAMFQFGSSGVVAGSGTYFFNLPALCAWTWGDAIGTAHYVHAASSATAGTVRMYSDSSHAYFLAPSSLGDVGASTPWVWGANDSISLVAQFEII